MANYWVQPTIDGKWNVKREGNSYASAVYDTQAEAITKARELTANSGGGEMIIKGLDNEIRQKNTIYPGNDPRNIPG